MSFFRLRTPPGNAWPPLPPGNLAPVWAAYQQLDRTHWLSPDEVERRQLVQVRLLLQHTVGTCGIACRTPQ